MGGLQALHKYVAVFVMLVAFHEVVMTQGRQIKALNRRLMKKDNTLFDNNVPASAEKAVDSSTKSNHHMYAVSEDSNGDYISAYRPTTPGNSPGVGHRKFGEETKDLKAKVVVVVQSPSEFENSLAEGSKTDFGPTDPGHSPGVGHSANQNKNNGEVGRVQNQLRN